MSTATASVPGDLLDAARELGRSSLVVGSVGNVSVRCDGGFRITPTTTPYEQLTEDDLVTVDADGVRVGGSREPSRETPLHAAVYAARADVSAIVHTHSPHAIAWSFLDTPLEPRLEEADYYDVGPVRVSRPAAAGTTALASAAVEALGDSAAVLLARHGALTVAPTLARALTLARLVEHLAQVALLVRGAAR